jgi:hypothetical protein
MNVFAGCKARVEFPKAEMSVGTENHGIVCMVNRLKPPGYCDEISAAYDENDGPLWEVTSISRMFTQYRLARVVDYLVIKPVGMTWSAIIPDKYLRRIVEDDEDLSVTTNEELTA